MSIRVLNNLITITLAIVGLLLIFPSTAKAKSYYYKNILVQININQDSTFDVEEEMEFSYSGKFSYAYRDVELKRLESISNIEVWDGIFNKKLSGDKIEISKGLNSAKIKWYYDLTNTDYRWIVKYRINGGIGNFANYDELYWNAIFGDRDVVIENAEIYVTLPKDVEKDQFQQKMFIGREGSENESQDFEIIDNRTLKYHAQNVAPGEIVTIVAGWPKGIVAETPVNPKVFLYKFLLYAGFIIPLLVFMIMFYLWWTRGRDKGGERSIAPEFALPSDLAPAEVGILIDEKADSQDLTATIIDLAVKGYLKITQLNKASFFKKENFKFELTKDPKKGLSNNERFVLNSLFSFSGGKEVTTDQLGDNFYVYIDDINKRFYKRVHDLGFFEKDPSMVRLRYFIIGGLVGALGIIGFILTPYVISALSTGFGFIISGATVMLFGYFMPAKTEKGRREFEKWLGFKMFLEKTEKFRIEDSAKGGSVSGGKVNQNIFEKYLPYAIVFGVEKKWAERFSEMKFSSPDWYRGPVYAGSYIGFTSSLGSSMTSVSSTIASSPSSSSGFSGGGGAGGGGGGGGGGAG